ncbi:hypothetical protein [Ferroplasma sp.]|jgi:hypothetical protein|uniref:hypothetical protein n=2 Tax=Ferroplasma TaxID=74968 RepID=UPI0017FEF637|nr:hypothetical protein [Ferroplasma sp.]HII83136.1 hypothetical protein [Ferroplasma sp.]
MQIENVTIKPVDDNDMPVHLKPTLKIEFEILDLLPISIIVDAYGDLRINNTIISRISRYNISATDKPIGQDYRNKVPDFLAQGYAELDKESLDFIEKSRDADKYKDVNFSASVTFSVLWRTKDGLFDGYQQHVRELSGESTIIKASDWVNKFVPKLGVGNFLVLEIPFYKDSDNDIIKVALYLLGEAEKAYQGWDAITVFVKCRQVVEKLKQKVYSTLSGNEKEKFDRLVAKGDKGVFGFLSFGIHEDTNNGDDYAHRIVTQQDAEAALYFTKILVKYTAELLNRNMVR